MRRLSADVETKKGSTDSPNPSLFREIVKSRLPLIPAKYPTKPTPVHIANNFVSIAIGTGSLSVELKLWVREQGFLAHLFQGSGENLQKDSNSLQELLRAYLIAMAMSLRVWHPHFQSLRK